MYKGILSFILVGLILNLAFYSTAGANTVSEKEAKFVAKVKTAVTKLGIGTDARIEVKLRDKTKIKGYVSEVRENRFVVADEKSGAFTEISYPQVKKVKGNNYSTGVKIAIGIAVAALIIAIAISFVKSDKYCEDFGTC